MDRDKVVFVKDFCKELNIDGYSYINMTFMLMEKHNTVIAVERSSYERLQELLSFAAQYIRSFISKSIEQRLRFLSAAVAIASMIIAIIKQYKLSFQGDIITLIERLFHILVKRYKL